MTSGDGQQISRLAAHFDPILAAFAPLWWIWPSPEMLLVVQAIAVALGALPVFWLARKHLGNDRAGLGFALVYLLYPATEWLTLNEFHPVALACPFLLLAFWFLDEDRLLPFAIFAVLAMTTKEEIGFVVAVLGLWYAIRRRRRPGAAIAGAGLLVSALAIAVVIPHYNAGAESSFYGRYDAIGGSAGGIAKTAVTEPWRSSRRRSTATMSTTSSIFSLRSRSVPARAARRSRRRAGARAEPALCDVDTRPRSTSTTPRARSRR